ncbi:MAG: hypothetical protein RXQ62_06755 [Nitrososphaeria archaeon]
MKSGDLKPDSVVPLLATLEDEFLVVLLVLMGPGPARYELLTRAAMNPRLAVRMVKLAKKIAG